MQGENKSRNRKMGDHSEQNTLRIISCLKFSLRKAAVAGTEAPLQKEVYFKKLWKLWSGVERRKTLEGISFPPRELGGCHSPFHRCSVYLHVCRSAAVPVQLHKAPAV